MNTDANNRTAPFEENLKILNLMKASMGIYIFWGGNVRTCFLVSAEKSAWLDKWSDFGGENG